MTLDNHIFSALVDSFISQVITVCVVRRGGAPSP